MPDMDFYIYPLLVLGGFAAGFINTLAGGGSMLTLPLLIFAGLPADVANGTNRVAILIQNISGVLGFRSRGIKPWRIGFWLCLPACLGAVAGASTAAEVDPLLLERIFGGVLIVLCAFLFLHPSRALVERPESLGQAPLSLKSFAVFFVVGFWGGFAQVGVGFLFLAGLILCSNLNLVHGNAVKIFTILIFTVLALGIFFAHGQVALVPGLVMAVGNAAGAWTASVLSVKKGAGWVRNFLLAAALLAALKLLGVLDLLWNLLVA
ncbi:MAG: sulfite exporter TauE/SafE family protein [Planctomycetota bacterium]|jgi:uncharacterized membrane protein YfcA